MHSILSTHFIYDAIKWLQELPIDKVVIVLLRSLQRVVSFWHSGKDDASKFGRILGLCTNLLSSFPNCHVSFVQRQTNVAVHAMATVSIIYVGPMCLQLYFIMYYPTDF